MTWLGTQHKEIEFELSGPGLMATFGSVVGAGLGVDAKGIGSQLATIATGPGTAKVGAAVSLMQTGLDAATAGKPVNQDVSNVTNAIRSVTRSPIVAGVLAATAVVPVVGPIVAGIGAAAIGITEGVCAIADEIGKLFGGGPSKEELLAQMRAEKLAIARGQLPAAIEASRKLQAQLAARSKYVKAEVLLDKRAEELAKKLGLAMAPIYVKAHYGDAKVLLAKEPKPGPEYTKWNMARQAMRQAQRDWAALQLVTNPDLQGAIMKLRQAANGAGQEQAEELVKHFTWYWQHKFAPMAKDVFQAEVNALLRKIPAASKSKIVHPKAKRQTKAIKVAAKAAARRIAGVAKAVREKGNSGILVGEGGRIARGKFVQAKSGPRRLLVSANGKIRAGHWTKAKAA